ncbi:MAG TPA: hypothetical protein V6D27_10655, partial [Vampirovibrionales bacterium]
MQLPHLFPIHRVSPPGVIIALLSILVVGCHPHILFSTTPALSTHSSPESPSETLDPVSQAVAEATAAADLTQSANTWEEWHQVAQHWQEAIARLKAVS